MTDEEKDPLANEKEITKKFLDVYEKIKKEAPSTKSKKELEEYFIENKEPSISIQAFSKSLSNQVVKKIYESSPMVLKQLNNGIEDMRMELEYGNSSTIEQLLIDDIIIEFFQMRNMQIILTSFMTTKGTANKNIRFADQMVSSAQRRFYKSIQTLTRLRKTGINLQINIATEGGKQVNIKK
ncbi:MAG: hypothetical protein Q7J07_04180 [Pelolinea sp.]|nr:hypothetical protein [Pelolinea sp.]